MICKNCGRDYTPLDCPACGSALGEGTCPACSEGSRVVCTNCGQQLEIARVDAEVSEGTSPDGILPGEPPRGPFGGPETMPGEMADIEAAAGRMPPQPEPPTPTEAFGHVMGADAIPEAPRTSFGEPETMPEAAADVLVAEGEAANAPAMDAPPMSVPPVPSSIEDFSRMMREDTTPEPPRSPFDGQEAMSGAASGVQAAEGGAESAPPVGGPAFTPPPPPPPPASYTAPPQDTRPAQPGYPPQGSYQPPPPPYQPGQAYPPPAQQPAAGPYGQYQAEPFAPVSPPPPQGAQGYGAPAGTPWPGQQQPFYTAPLQKVQLGGWMMAYFIIACIGLAFMALSVITGLANGTSSALTIIIQLVCHILPAVMIIVCILQRSANFKKWFLFRAVVGFIEAGFCIVAAVLIGAASSSSSFVYYLEDALYDLMPYGYDSYMLYDTIVGIVVATFVIMAVVLVAWYVVWLLYFRRSRRVAYTFDARNNPPRR